MTGAPLSRRELLVRTARPTLAQADDDERLIAEALLLEQVVVASYDVAVAAARRLPPASRLRGLPPLPELLSRLRAQEREHVEVLASKLEELGGRASALPGGKLSLARARSQLGLRQPLEGLDGREPLTAFAIELENVQLSRHLGAIAALRDGRLIELLLQIAGAEGQHATVLRRLRTGDPSLLVPSAFEHGTSPPP